MLKKINSKLNILLIPENFKTDNKFDVILNMEIIEHVEDVDFFKILFKIIKKMG